MTTLTPPRESATADLYDRVSRFCSPGDTFAIACAFADLRLWYVIPTSVVSGGSFDLWVYSPMPVPG